MCQIQLLMYCYKRRNDLLLKITFTSFVILCFLGSITLKAECRNGETRHEFYYTEFNMAIDYIPIPLPQLIGRADLVVIGKVTGFSDSTFNFLVEEFLINKDSSNTIVVKKYIPSEFEGPRPLPYATKQSFILILKKPEKNIAGEAWKIIGHIGEGEMPIEDGFVYFEGSNIIGLERKPFSVQRVSRNVQRFNLTDFKDAVKDYRNCFSWKLTEETKNNKKRLNWRPSKECSDNSIRKYQEKSWIHEYLVKETINKITITDNE